MCACMCIARVWCVHVVCVVCERGVFVCVCACVGRTSKAGTGQKYRGKLEYLVAMANVIWCPCVIRWLWAHRGRVLHSYCQCVVLCDISIQSA